MLILILCLLFLSIGGVGFYIICSMVKNAIEANLESYQEHHEQDKADEDL